MKQYRLSISIVVFFSFFLIFANLDAQTPKFFGRTESDSMPKPKPVVQDSSIKSLVKDTVCFKLKFLPGDTLLYFVESYDSIIIDYGDPLLKIRKEYYQVVCDSLGYGDSFFLSLKLIGFKSIEKSAKNKKVERNETEWLNHNVQIELDSLGNRISYRIDKVVKEALCPGGAFQPYLFFPFKESCKKVEESWMLDTTDYLCENGLPLPSLKYTILFRAKPKIDTLDANCLRFEYVKTGQGSILIESGKDNIQVTNVINSFGIYDIHSTEFVPVHFKSSIEQNLTIHSAKDQQKKGQHFITSEYTLVKFIPSEDRLGDEENDWEEEE